MQNTIFLFSLLAGFLVTVTLSAQELTAQESATFNAILQHSEDIRNAR